MFGLRWFGPKSSGSGIGPWSWQAWVVIGGYVAIALGLVPALHIPGPVKRQIWGLATLALIAIMLATYSKDRPHG